MLQLVPLNPDAHEHVYVWVTKLGLHVAPFWQGLEEHGLLSFDNKFNLINYKLI